MGYTIEVDDDVYGRLKGAAEPFVDTPNSVLRRFLGCDGPSAATDGGYPSAASNLSAGESSTPPPVSTTGQRSKKGSSKKKKSSSSTRVPAGSILPEDQYEMPLLRALVDAGGSAASRDIVDAVGRQLDGLLKDIDRETLKSGAVRWENRIQFVRLKLIERGWMEKDTPRGVWAISAEGRKQLEGSGK
jgi:hypothetical protein